MVAEAGTDKPRIMDVGRWKTLGVLERYFQVAQYKKVAEVSRKVWGDLSENPTASSTALEKGLKDVKELLCRVLEKWWSVGFTESRPMIAGFKVRPWCTSHACSEWIRHQICGRHAAVGISAGLLRNCLESRSEQWGRRVDDASKRKYSKHRGRSRRETGVAR